VVRGRLTVKATNGDTQPGRRRYDRRIVELAGRGVQEGEGIDLKADRKGRASA